QFIIRPGEVDPEPAEYADRQTLRCGLNAEYMINPFFSIVGGLDYMPTRYREGQFVAAPAAIARGVDEDIVNASLGLRYRVNDFITASLNYNFTNSDSDFAARNYDRNRISLGVTAQF
ncbi:MAG: outer membrane beta-barrel protein, partial [Luteolibacter sp.]